MCFEMEKEFRKVEMALSSEEQDMAMVNGIGAYAYEECETDEPENEDDEDDEDDLDEEEEVVREETGADEKTDEYYIEKMMEWLMPWAEKSGNLQEVSDWEMKLPEMMMLKLLKLWLTNANRKRLDKVLHGYHPLDRAAMCYALLVFVMTGHRMHFKSILPEQHFKVLCDAIEADMPELFFAEHLLYNIIKFGKKHLLNDGEDGIQQV